MPFVNYQSVCAIGLMLLLASSTAFSGTITADEETSKFPENTQTGAKAEMLRVDFVSPISSYQKISPDRAYNESELRFTTVPLSAIFDLSGSSSENNSLAGRFQHTILIGLMKKTGLCLHTAPEYDSYGNQIAVGIQEGGYIHEGRSQPTFYELLNYCANDYPLEFKALSSLIRPYTTWRASETQALTTVYAKAMKSGLLSDRLLGRLMNTCMTRFVAKYSEDSSQELSLSDIFASGSYKNPGACAGSPADGACDDQVNPYPDLTEMLLYCAKVENLNFADLLTGLDLSKCSEMSGPFDPTTAVNMTSVKEVNDAGLRPGLASIETNLTDKATLEKYVFDYDVLIRGCILTEKTSPSSDSTTSTSSKELSYGAEVALGLLPTTKIIVERADSAAASASASATPSKVVQVKLQTYPMSFSPAEVYDALYLRAYTLVSSPAFTDMKTRGCIPSPFAPKNFDELVTTVDSDWERYCSVWVPSEAIQRLGDSSLEDDAQFFWSVLARRIAVIQSLEILNGSEIIARETLNFLKTADSELARIYEPTAAYIADASKLYRDSVQLAYTTKLEDLLLLTTRYRQEKSAVSSMVDTARSGAYSRFSADSPIQ